MNGTLTTYELLSVFENTSRSQRCLYNPTAAHSAPHVTRFLLVVPIWLFVAFLGLIGNTLAYLVLRRELRPSSTSYLLKTLSIVDLIVLIIYTLDDSFVRIYVSTGAFESYFEVYNIIHPFLWPLKWFSKTLSVYTIMLVTAERYIAVCKPLQAASFCTIKKAKIAFLAICLFSIVYNLPKCWQLRTLYIFDPCTARNRPKVVSNAIFSTSFFWSTIYGVAIYMIFMFVVPFLVLAILNFFLIRMLRGGATCGNFNINTSRRQRHKKTITKRIVIIVIVFIILELPVFIMNLLNGLRRLGVDLGLNPDYVIQILQSTYVISGMNSVVNFYVYFLSGSSFRHTLFNMINGKHDIIRPNRTSLSGMSENDLTPMTEVTSLQAVCIQVTQRSNNSFISSCKRSPSSIRFDVVSDCV